PLRRRVHARRGARGRGRSMTPKLAWLATAIVVVGGACVERAPRVRAARPPAASAPAPPPAPIAPPFAPTGRPGRFADALDASGSQRGTLHTNATESDGDSPPEAVYAWYRDHGYNFLALSDHNKLTDPGKYKDLERPGFVILPAEEVTLFPNK